MKHTLLLFAFTAAGLLSYAQPAKTPVAVFAFVPPSPEYKTRTIQIQEMIIETIRSSPKIDVIDRSKDSLLMEELKLQIREVSVVAKGLVDQGRVLGAKDMIVGTVSNVSIEEKHAPGVIGSGLGLGKSDPKAILYTATVGFSLQLSDVESGKIIGHKSFSNRSGKVFGSLHVELATSAEGAILQAVTTCQRQVLAWLDEALSPGIRIVGVDQRDGDGTPKTLFVSGIAASVRNSATVVINEISEMDGGNGQMLERRQRLAEMRIAERQGDVTVCRITSGERVIEERMKAGAKLECIIR